MLFEIFVFISLRCREGRIGGELVSNPKCAARRCRGDPVCDLLTSDQGLTVAILEINHSSPLLSQEIKVLQEQKIEARRAKLFYLRGLENSVSKV